MHHPTRVFFLVLGAVLAIAVVGTDATASPVEAGVSATPTALVGVGLAHTVLTTRFSMKGHASAVQPPMLRVRVVHGL